MKTKQVVLYNITQLPDGETMDSVMKKFKEDGVLIYDISNSSDVIPPKVIELNIEE